ncbi:MAG: DUF1588 domain-containing protein [Bdellovibrionales bacterium]
MGTKFNMRSALLVTCALWATLGCSGSLRAKKFESKSAASNAPPDYTPDGSIYAGLRRLSSEEIDNTLAKILLDATKPASTSLPSDSYLPFDNLVAGQYPQPTLIFALEEMAMSVSKRLLENAAIRNQVIGCQNRPAGDSTCMDSVVAKLGRLFFRRPLAAKERSELLSIAMVESNQAGYFDSGVDVLLRILIQDPRFLYRIEESDSNVAPSIRNASKLSFLILGSGPDDALLSKAEAGLLATRVQLEAEARRLLADPLAIKRAQRFHQMWMRYFISSLPESLNAPARDEADALIARVLFSEKKKWTELLQATQTTVSSTIGQTIYGISGLPTTPILTNLPADRKGLLSLPAILSNGAKFGDTSPTRRGLYIRTNLLCQTIPDPPPTVNPDLPPEPTGGANCKYDRYKAHAVPGSTCIACHQLMDPIGFGLEAYDPLGRKRSYEPNSDGSENVNCPVRASGEVAGVGSFSGPAQLSEVLIQSGQIESCLAQRALEFAAGRTVSSVDSVTLNNLKTKFASGTYQDLILAIVTSDAFAGAAAR